MVILSRKINETNTFENSFIPTIIITIYLKLTDVVQCEAVLADGRLVLVKMVLCMLLST